MDLEWGCTSSSKLVKRKLTRFSHKRAYFADENSTFVALFKKSCPDIKCWHFAFAYPKTAQFQKKLHLTCKAQKIKSDNLIKHYRDCWSSTTFSMRSLEQMARKSWERLKISRRRYSFDWNSNLHWSSRIFHIIFVITKMCAFLNRNYKVQCNHTLPLGSVAIKKMAQNVCHDYTILTIL